MPVLTLPRTRGCLVCGRDNARGLHLRLDVDDERGVVTTRVTPSADHAGFTDIVHGGLIATVADEAMVWAATWHGRRFCLAGELTVRYRRPVHAGQPIRFEAGVESSRSRLIVASFRCVDADGTLLAHGSAKYVPMSAADHALVVATFLDEPASREAADVLRGVEGVDP